MFFMGVNITMLRAIFAESIFSGAIQNRYLVSQNRYARGPAKGNGSG